MKEYYVYAYCDPRKPVNDFMSGFQPFYIGKGTKGRMFDHIQNRKGRNPIFANKINKIKSLGLTPIVMKVKEFLTEDEAFQLEKDLIAQFGMYPIGCLCNLTEGGVGGKQSEVVIQKIRDTLTGRPLSEETRRKISKGLKGKSRDNETKSKISQTLMGQKHSDNRRKNIADARNARFMSIENFQRYLVFADGVQIATIFGCHAISKLFPGIATTLRTGKPITRGPNKGWQVIKEQRLEAQQFAI